MPACIPIIARVAVKRTLTSAKRGGEQRLEARAEPGAEAVPETDLLLAHCPGD